MQTVLAQSATQLTQSNNGEQNYPFAEVVQRIAMGKLKAGGLTRERANLNPEKLVKSVLADYRNCFAAIYPDKSRIPTHVYEKIQDEVGKWITGKLAAVIHAGNAISSRRSFTYRKPRLGEDNDSPIWLETVTNQGENRISFEEQRFACKLEIGRIEKRLKDLRAKPNPDYDLEKSYTEKLTKQERELTYIEGEISRQNSVKE